MLHRSQRHGQNAGDGAQCSIQTQFSQKGAFGAGGGELSLGGQNPDEDGQIIHRAGFTYIGRCQIDGDPAGRPLVMQILNGTSYPLAAFFYGRIRKADQIELRQPSGQISFYLYKIAHEPSDTQA